MKTWRSALAAVAVVLSVCTANAVTISDPSDWSSGWVFSTIEIGGVGTASSTVEPTGGNPNARLNATTVTPTATDIAFGAALYQAVSVAAPPSGTAFVMKLDVLSGPGGFGGGQAVQALVSQGGSLYQANVGITGWPINSFTTLTFNGTFTPGAFTKVSGPGPATPLFDGVTPTSFGFAYGNSQSATLTQYYDNWNIAFAVVVAQGTVSAVPTLSDGTLLLLAGLLTLGAFAALRRRS